MCDPVLFNSTLKQKQMCDRKIWMMYYYSPLVATFFTAVLLSLTLDCTASVFPLERVHPGPSDHTVGMEVHRARDRARHTRLFLHDSRVDGAANFDVFGAADLYLGGLYFTRVRLGTPPREYRVVIDTGSDLFWVACSSCSNCPHSSLLVGELKWFDPARSTTSHLVSCSDPLCPACSHKSHECGYSYPYVNHSRTSGFYIYDLFYLNMILENSTTITSSSVMFGCSTKQSGRLAQSESALEGIFGFGHQRSSVVSQLAFMGIAPWVFSHCLKGGDNGGGILVLGEILDPNIVYTPLGLLGAHYSVNLQSIAINGHPLPIDQSVFAKSDNEGTIVDSGTTFAYLPKEAFDTFVKVLNADVSQYATPIIYNGDTCYKISTSLSDVFPPISLNFMGGASMLLRPEQYPVNVGLLDGAALWCIGFQVAQNGLTVLGDVVLKDKIVVYDIARQRIGWANYDCSLSVNVSITLGNPRPPYHAASAPKRVCSWSLLFAIFWQDKIVLVNTPSPRHDLVIGRYLMGGISSVGVVYWI